MNQPAQTSEPVSSPTVEAAPEIRIHFPRLRPMQDFPAALIEGELGLTDGCFVLAAPGGPWVLLWSPSYSPIVVGDGAGVGRNGLLFATVGQRVEFGGGEVSDTDFALELTGGALPPECRQGRYWIVSPP
jgi:hypothetical protein